MMNKTESIITTLWPDTLNGNSLLLILSKSSPHAPYPLLPLSLSPPHLTVTLPIFSQIQPQVLLERKNVKNDDKIKMPERAEGSPLLLMPVSALLWIPTTPLVTLLM